jgi:hypothetical protein
MPRIAEKPQCSDDVLQTLKAWGNSRTIEARMVERANTILMSLDGQSDSAIAGSLRLRPNTVGMWRHRFIEGGLQGLYDLPRRASSRNTIRPKREKPFWRFWKPRRQRDMAHGTGKRSPRP